jgi:hypothetical protein
MWKKSTTKVAFEMQEQLRTLLGYNILSTPPLASKKKIYLLP